MIFLHLQFKKSLKSHKIPQIPNRVISAEPGINIPADLCRRVCEEVGVRATIVKRKAPKGLNGEKAISNKKRGNTNVQ